MIHSRPGFTPRVTRNDRHDPPPSRVRSDMQPALAKRTSAASAIPNSPLKRSPDEGQLPIERMQAQAEAAFKRMQAQQAASPKTEIIGNPAPSPTPVITSPHKE